MIQRRQEVAEIAPRVIVARRNSASLAGRCRVDEAEPRLLERLAGIELNVQRCRGARVDGRHGRREAARVVGHGLIGEVDDRQEIAVLAEIEIEPAREELVLVRALCPITVDLLIGQAHEVVQPLGLAAGLDLRFLEPIAAGRHANLRVGLSAAAFGGQADDAARCVAVQRGARAADDLDLTRCAEIDAIDRPLPIGERLGDTVDEHLDAANAELRARAEAADRHPQVLRKVVAVLHEHAGHAAQRFVQCQLLPRELNFVFADHADRRRCAVERALDHRGPDDDLLERGLAGRRLCERRRSEEEGRGRATGEAVVPAE